MLRTILSLVVVLVLAPVLSYFTAPVVTGHDLSQLGTVGGIRLHGFPIWFQETAPGYSVVDGWHSARFVSNTFLWAVWLAAIVLIGTKLLAGKAGIHKAPYNRTRMPSPCVRSQEAGVGPAPRLSPALRQPKQTPHLVQAGLRIGRSLDDGGAVTGVAHAGMCVAGDGRNQVADRAGLGVLRATGEINDQENGGVEFAVREGCIGNFDFVFHVFICGVVG
jgi:hypothetical protein